MDPLHAHDRAAAEFEAKAKIVGADTLDAPTPCEGWSIRDLYAHVAGGNVMTVRLLDGATADEARAAIGSDVLGDDPVGAVKRTNAESATALRAADLTMMVTHPAMTMPASQLLNFRTGDLLLHAWDLARAAGIDETLDPDVVAHVWEAMSPMAPIIGTVGVFGSGPSGDVPDDAPLQQRLLDLSGRRP